MGSLKQQLKRFRREDSGSMVLEAVLVLPILLWGFLALYTFWDAYRATTTIQKAGYAISDMISREQRPVNAGYINGMRLVMDAMIARRYQAELRVSSVTWVASRNQYEVLWSSTSGTASPTLTTTTLQPLVGKIPTLVDGDTVVLVETWVDYDPAIDIGLTGQRFSQFIVTRPRYSPKIVLQ